MSDPNRNRQAAPKPRPALTLDPSPRQAILRAMTLAEFPELQKLTSDEKSALADELWLDAMRDDMPVPEHHKEMLETRWRDYKAGKIKTITLAELERRLDQK